MIQAKYNTHTIPYLCAFIFLPCVNHTIIEILLNPIWKPCFDTSEVEIENPLWYVIWILLIL